MAIIDITMYIIHTYCKFRNYCGLKRMWFRTSDLTNNIFRSFPPLQSGSVNKVLVCGSETRPKCTINGIRSFRIIFYKAVVSGFTVIQYMRLTALPITEAVSKAQSMCLN